jgi:hypothetical protein
VSLGALVVGVLACWLLALLCFWLFSGGDGR